jgi:imidazolonepropionase-like amidohydrolase
MMLATLVALAAPAAPAPPQETRRDWAVFAERLHDPALGTLEGALVTIANGKIVAVVGGARPSKDALRVATLTPGLVDASVRIDAGPTSVEQSREVTPELRVEPTLDVFDRAWERQLRHGVTTAFAAPPDWNVVGGLGVVLKTGGAPSIEGRVVKRDAALRGAIGTQPSQRNHPMFGRPSDFYSRRPTTRMGVEWEWRKALWDAAASAQDPARAFPGSEVLVRALKGELPVVIQAWGTQDVRTAVFLKEECVREGLGTLRLVIDAGAEAWREPALLVRTGTPVVLPPFTAEGRTADNAFLPWNAAKVLHDAGVPVALSAHGGAFEGQLAIQAGRAMRGGLPFDAALAAVTSLPAQILGVDGRVGSLAPGKDADLVMWSGPPFEASSGVVGVMLEGALVVDPRPAQ